MFYEGRKGFYKTFCGTKKRAKIKFKLIFILILFERLGTVRVNIKRRTLIL